mgnify:CR=1 FL=1
MVKRVLSLDGGGVRCILQAQILNDMYPGLTGHQILNRFDVVSATSAGSVVLAGLLSDLRPYDIFEDFQTESFLDAIFARTYWPFFPKWSTKKKRAGLLRVLPKSDQCLHQIAKDVGISRIIIPAFDVQSRRAHIFDSYSPTDITLLDAVHASSTAPVTYFDAPATIGKRTYWDGGVCGLNNPAAYGTAVAKEMFPDEDVWTLSLGSGVMVTADDLNQTKDAFYPGAIRSCRNLISALVDDAPDVSTRYLWTMTKGRYIRINPVIGPEQKGKDLILPEVYSTDKILGGMEGYKSLSETKLDSKDAGTIEKLALIGTYYLEDKIPSQTISDMDDLNSTSTDSKFYSRLKDLWLKYQEN